MWSLGIPTSVWVYLGTAVAVFGTVWTYRRRLLRQPSRLERGDLVPQQVGYLHAGERLAVYAALAGLRAAEAVRLTPARTLSANGPLAPGATALDKAVHAAAGAGVAQQALRADPRVVAAVGRIRDELEEAGLLLGPAASRRVRRGARLMLLLVVIGVAGISGDLVGGRSPGWLGLATLAVFGGYLLLIAKLPRVSVAAEVLLGQLRRTYDHLGPQHRPALTTYGPTATAMAVALFGTDVLGQLDPEMGAEAYVEHRALDTGPTGAPGSGYAGYGGADSGSGDAGGGGCGSGSGCGGGGGGG
ncbi:TIGR04222 domain-containing membrane protein [Plantactinospora veratri]|uniref:TIGR04222 domain-containing membrane protein n=1 Tax=Plantactinospora veratri TaxID=1436122 RepID=A0ABU7SFZ4_9ACTN